jgi:hypothetical protein
MPTFSESRYRWTSQFFREDLRLIPFVKPKVRDKFQQYSGLSGENLKTAFVSDYHNYEPLVKVKHLPGLYGYTPPIGEEIQLATIFIEELEAALPKNRVPRGQVYAPSELEEKALLLLEATVLHELVHYFRRRFDFGGARLNAMSARGRSVEEALAQQFEKEAYGMLHTVQNLSIARYFPRTAATASK